MRSKNIKFEYVDALRGIAVLLVLLIHSSQPYSSTLPIWIKQLAETGRYGVQLFYLMSAFTLFLSLSKKIDMEKSPIINFFIRRFFRIAPLFYIAVLCYLPLNGSKHWLGGQPGITISNFISTITFTNGFNPYWINSLIGVNWSVAVEVIFYLCIPFLYYKIKNLKQALLGLLISILIAQSLAYYFKGHPMIQDKILWSEYLYMYFPSQFPIFMLGILLFFLKSPINISGQIQIYKKFSGLLLFLTLIAFYFLSFLKIDDQPIHYLYGLIFLFFSLFLSFRNHGFFVNTFTIWIGKISYSIYLIHWGVLAIIKKILPKVTLFPNGEFYSIIKFFLTLIILIITSSGLAFLTYNFIEVPAQEYGKKIINKREQEILQ